MHTNIYIHILHVWYEWLRVHKRALLSGTFAILACLHTSLVTDQLVDAYILSHFSEPQKFLLYAPRKQPTVTTRRIVVVEPIESSSSSSDSFHPAAETESSSSSSSPSLPGDIFPQFLHTVMPVGKVPNWGAMRTPEEWNRTYRELDASDFVDLPSYNIDDLTSVTMDKLKETRDDPSSVRMLTEKLFYSTHYFGAYDLDSHEFEAVHPGIDMKLAEGTPIRSIAGGKVHVVRAKTTGLGLHVIIEHRLPDGSRYFSIYGHLGSVAVEEGDTVKPGNTIGYVGMTGKTTAPHLHLQIDRGYDEEVHTPYMPNYLPGRAEAARFVVHPIEFINRYAR